MSITIDLGMNYKIESENPDCCSKIDGKPIYCILPKDLREIYKTEDEWLELGLIPIRGVDCVLMHPFTYTKLLYRYYRKEQLRECTYVLSDGFDRCGFCDYRASNGICCMKDDYVSAYDSCDKLKCHAFSRNYRDEFFEEKDVSSLISETQHVIDEISRLPAVYSKSKVLNDIVQKYKEVQYELRTRGYIFSNLNGYALECLNVLKENCPRTLYYTMYMLEQKIWQLKFAKNIVVCESSLNY